MKIHLISVCYHLTNQFETHWFELILKQTERVRHTWEQSLHNDYQKFVFHVDADFDSIIEIIRNQLSR